MWQSAALAGALSLGGSVPTEFGTCWAWLCPTWIPEVVAAIAAIEAPLMKVRRAIIFLPICLGSRLLDDERCALSSGYSLSQSRGRSVPLMQSKCATTSLAGFPAASNHKTLSQDSV